MKVRMSCNYILPEHDDMVSLSFQTEPDTTSKNNLSQSSCLSV